MYIYTHDTRPVKINVVSFLRGVFTRKRHASTNAVFIIVLLTVIALAPAIVWAHRFGGPNDPCERKIGASFIHITLYQPQFDPDAEYCDVVPREGNTVLVVDVLGDDLRKVPMGLEVIATGDSQAPRTILSVPATIYRRGVADVQVLLWISEEFFAVPFHWPFVVYGWLAGGMFAVWGETILRLYEIEKAEEEENAQSTSRPQIVAD